MKNLNNLIKLTSQLLNKPSSQDVSALRLIKLYESLSQSKRYDYINSLSLMHGIDYKGIDLSKIEKNLSAIQNLRESLVPNYRELFINLARSQQGISFLVNLRENTRRQMKLNDSENSYHQIESLKLLENELYDLLRCWFSSGLFKLERITWESPCYLLEVVSKLEAVHPVRSWVDIKSRVGPYRRVFVFTHQSMQSEPIVILHTALSDTIPDTMSTLIHQETKLSNSKILDSEEAENIKSAIFYSISAPQRGLQGIDLGRMMIKRVVKELLSEYPGLEMFSTLSPIPGFRKWLFEEIEKSVNCPNSCLLNSILKAKGDAFYLHPDFSSQFKAVLLKYFSTPSTFANSKNELKDTTLIIDNKPIKIDIKDLLIYMCMHYIVCARTQNNNPIDPVANFHFTNGAQLWRINWAADLSPRGFQQSLGLMVNYRYYLEKTDDLGLKFLNEKCVSISLETFQSLKFMPTLLCQNDQKFLVEKFD